MKSINSKFQKWKRILHAIDGQKQAKLTKGRMSTIQSQIHKIQGSMIQYSETIQNYQDKISHIELQLNQSYENREKLTKDLQSMKREKRAKLKFLAASLIFGQMQGVICGIMRMKNAFEIWKADSMCMKIAQNAFNKVLQLNHKHAGARFDTAFYLMSRFRKKFNKRMIYFSFRSIAHHQAVVFDGGSKILASHSGVFGNKYQNEQGRFNQDNEIYITPNRIQRKKGSVERHLHVNLQQIKPKNYPSQISNSNNTLFSTSKENFKPSSPYLIPNSRKGGSAERKIQPNRSTSGKRIY